MLLGYLLCAPQAPVQGTRSYLAANGASCWVLSPPHRLHQNLLGRDLGVCLTERAIEMPFAVCCLLLTPCIGPGAYLVRFLRVHLDLELCVGPPTWHSALSTWCPRVGATHQERAGRNHTSCCSGCCKTSDSFFGNNSSTELFTNHTILLFKVYNLVISSVLTSTI